MKLDTRERLIVAARDLFHKHGYNATGISQILQTADCRSGSLYYYFPTKEDLLIAVLEWYKANLFPALLDPIFARISDPVERVFGVLDGYRQLLHMTAYTYGCPIGNLALELGDAHPTVRGLLADNFSGWKNAIRQCLDDASPRLPAGVDRAQLASFVLTIMEGAVMQARTYSNVEPFDEAVTQLRDYIERLLADGTTWGAPASESAESTPSLRRN